MKKTQDILKKRVLVYFHTHWDREWYRTRVEFNFRLVKVFDDVLKKLKNNDLPCFYFDGQVSAIKDYLKFRPENENLILKLIKANRLFIGPFYCATDSFLVSIQSYLANLDLGIKYSKELGYNNFIGYCADTFGHSKSLPEIFKYYGFESGVFWRGLGNLPQCFNWNGLKSVYLKQGYFHDYLNSDKSFKEKAVLIEAQLRKIDDKTQNVLLLPIGADHLAVCNKPLNQIRNINKFLTDYELEISSPFEYLNIVKSTKSKKGELRDNSKNFILPGVLSSRIDIKTKNACSQWELLRIAEPLNALCYVNNLIKNNYQPQIDAAKEELIKNHAHDSIYGCSIDAVHKDMIRRFDIANQTSRCVVNEILNELSSDENEKINIINLSDYNYSGLCTVKTDKKLDNAQLISKKYDVDAKLLSDINKIPVTEDFKTFYKYLIKTPNIKPFSIAQYRKYKKQSDIQITRTSIENSKISLEIKRGKIELTDKKTGKIYNNFIEFVDYADAGDSYNSSPLKRNKRLKAEIINSRISVSGELQSVLEIEYQVYIPSKITDKKRAKVVVAHFLKLKAILDTECDYIKFELNWENKSLDHKLKVSFNFDQPITKTISDDMTEIIKRNFDPDYEITKLMPAQKGVELKTNTAPMQTFVSTQGATIITKGLNEYEVRKNALEITLLRATGIISNPKNPTRGTPAGPPISTPDLQQIGKNCVEFALIFSDKIKEIKAAQQAFYGCAFAFFGNIKPQKLLDTNNKNFIFIDAKYDKNLNIRILDKGKIKNL